MIKEREALGHALDLRDVGVRGDDGVHLILHLALWNSHINLNIKECVLNKKNNPQIMKT